MQSKDIITVLSSNEGIRFIQNNLNKDPVALALKYAGKTSFDLKIALQLIAIYRKAAQKAPIISKNLLAINQRSYEQSTSEEVAKYKSTFISGGKLLDLTAGIGVDSIYLAENFEQVEAIELNQSLHLLASFNLKKLGVTNIKRIHGDAIELLPNRVADWIYVDPDRRSSQRRSVDLRYLKPDILANIDLMKKVASKIYIKLSPLFDLSEIMRCFDNLASVHVIAEKNEVKEVGIIIDCSLANETSNAFIHLADVSNNFRVSVPFEEYFSRKNYTYENNYNKFLHIPSVLVAKSSCFHFFTKNKGVSKHLNFQIFFSKNSALTGFRTFSIIDKSSLTVKKIKESLRKNNLNKLNIIIKGINESPAKWHKKLGTTDGGDWFLFLLKSRDNEAILCRRFI